MESTHSKYKVGQEVLLPNGEHGEVFRVNGDGGCATVYILDENGNKIRDGYTCRNDPWYKVAITTKAKIIGGTK